MGYIRKKQGNRQGFTLVELIVVITILGILMAIAVPSIIHYFKSTDMIKANESARQIYVAAQNKLTAMKANGLLDGDAMEGYDLRDVLDGSAAKKAQEKAKEENINIRYFYINTVDAKKLLNQSGQSLDAELVSDKASIVIELDPVNGSVYGVFFASYSDSTVNPEFDYDGMNKGKFDLQGATGEFCESDDLRSEGKARIGYYGGESARTEYESSLKTPMLEVINGEELMIKISSYGQPSEFSDYKVTLTWEKGEEYYTYINREDFVQNPEAPGEALEGNYYTLLLDSLAEGYSITDILGHDYFTRVGTDQITLGDNITVSVIAVNGTEGTKNDSKGKNLQSASNEVEVNSLFAEKIGDVNETNISVANARHLQNLDKIAGENDYNSKSTVVQQIKDIDWNNTLAYYNGLTNMGMDDKDKAGNADEKRKLKGEEDNADARFTPISSGMYTFTAENSENNQSLKDMTDTGYKIYNLPIKGTEINESVGLFASFKGSIMHVNLVNIKVESVEESTNVGALVGHYDAEGNNQIQNCHVYLEPEDSLRTAVNCEEYTVSGGKQGTGGLIGYVMKGEIKDSFAAINVKGGSSAGSAVGGFAGVLKNAQISSSYSSGQVSGDERAALGCFAGSATPDTMIKQCYNTGDIASDGNYMGSFLGEYLGENLEKKQGEDLRKNKGIIIESYTTGLKRSLEIRKKSVTTLDFVGNEVQGKVGENCFYLGRGESYGAKGLNAAQLGGHEAVSNGNFLNEIYLERDGWRYPENYGTEEPGSETDKALTHPYYYWKDVLDKNIDTVFPYPARSVNRGTESNPIYIPIPHYGDWSLTLIEEDVNLQLFYYEKYGENDYGYYLKDRSVGSDLDPTKTILETGYGLIVKEKNGEVPEIEGIKAYYNGDEKYPVGEDDLTLTAMNDFYLVVDGVYYYGMKLDGSVMNAAQIGKDSWQSVMTQSYEEDEIPYNYIRFAYGEKEFYFNPCFAKALGDQAEGSRAPEWFGNIESAFEVRTEAQLKCIDGFGEYKKDGVFYHFKQDRTEISLSQEAWIPLCSRGFMGSYEGNGGTIRELNIKNASSVVTETNLGLFDTIGNDGSAANANSGSTIRNLIVETSATNTDAIKANKPDKNDAYFGILAGKCNKSSWIENCDTVLNATINFSNGNAGNDFTKDYYRVYIGGLVGYSNGTIKGCQVQGEGEIRADANQEVCGGGFAGYLAENSLVESGDNGIQCLTNTNVRLNGYVAGFAAENKGKIYDAYSGGNIEGSQLYSAGFVVLNHGNAVIERCSSGSSTSQPIRVSMEQKQTGTNSSSAGFVGVNGGTIRYSRVFARVETWGTYTAGFVLDNAGEIEECDTYAYVKNNGNMAAGFASSNARVVYTLVGKDNIRREPFEGSGQIENCNVYSIENKRETVNIEAGQQAAGFVLTNASSIKSCGARVSIKTLGGEKVHASGAGFAVTNTGDISRSYTNSIVTITTSSATHDAKAAGFVFQNSSWIYESYADCITTAKSDNNSQAAGFVFEDKKTDVTGENIRDCYALLEVSAEEYTKGNSPKTSQAAGFAMSGSTTGIGIKKSYCAVSLTGIKQYGFAPSGVKTEECYYLKYSDNANVSGAGEPLSEEELRSLNLGDSWEEGTVNTTHPNSGTLEGMKYPYPKLVDMDHYGDWPEIVDNDGAIFYYEQYEDGTNGVYFLKNNYSAYSTLDDEKKIKEWGYGLILKGNSSHVTIYARDASGKSENIVTNSINAWLDKKISVIGSPLGADYNFHSFKKQKLDALQDKIESADYQYLYTKVEATKTYNLFNPLFAAAINTKSYVGFDENDMPEASFGKAGDPFEIRHADHFHYMSNRGYESNGSKYRYFEQTHDVNLKDNNNTKVWNPSALGHRKDGAYTSQNPYIGNYEGNGRKITGFVLPDQTDDAYIGLFGYLGGGIGNGSVSNLTLKVEKADINLSQGTAAGLLAGYVAKDSGIYSCTVNTETEMTYQGMLDMAGGIAGGSEGTISDTRLTGDSSLQVTGSSADAMFGGLIGINKGTISKCSVDGIKISSNINNGYVAGLSGSNEGTISDSSVKNAEVQSSENGSGGNAAGFVIQNLGSVLDSSVENTQVYAEYTAAGFVYNNGQDASGTLDGIDSSLNDSQDNDRVRISGCFYDGGENKVTTLKKDAAGFARYNFGTIEDSYSASGEVLAPWTYAGDDDSVHGLAGFCHTNFGMITRNTYTTMDVNVLTGQVQATGFVVDNQGSIQGDSINLVRASGDVSSNSQNAAGFAIWNSGIIDYARYSGSEIKAINQGKSAAGFVVENKNTGKISHSNVSGNGDVSIQANEDGAGFAIINRGEIDSSQAQKIAITFQVDNVQRDAAGFVCANQKNAVVSRSTVQGSVVKQQSSQNGIGGFAASNAGEISNQCVASVNISTNNNASGFVGTNESTGVIRGNALTPIRVIGSDLQITASEDKSSGFAGINKGIIEYASVELKGNNQIGRSSSSAGFVYENQNRIQNCQIASANINGSTKISGFAMINSETGRIEKCVVGSRIELNADKVYGFLEENEGTILLSSMQAKVAANNYGYGFARTNEEKGAISQCSVTGKDISGGSTETVGFVQINEGQLNKVSVEITGDIIGQKVYGFLKENKESGTITDAVLKGNAIRGTDIAIGFAERNIGRIEAKEEFLVDIDVFNVGADISVGFVVENYGTITGKKPEGKAEAVFVTYCGTVQSPESMGMGFVYNNEGTIFYAAVVSEEGIKAHGAAAGFVNENSSKIDHCYVRGEISSKNDVASGFVDSNTLNSNISSSYVEGKVETNSDRGVAGFARENMGMVVDSFTTCEVEHNGSATENSEASGFVLDNQYGTVKNSYSSSAVSASDDDVKRHTFAGKEGNVEKVYYLDWPGISGCTKESEKIIGLEKEKLIEIFAILGSEWQKPEDGSTYLYPIITGLPIPTAMLDDIAAYGVAYYEMSGGKYYAYSVDAEGNVTDGLQHSGQADEWGYAVFSLKNTEKPSIENNEVTVGEGRLFSSGRYDYYKITNLSSYDQLVNVSVSDDSEMGYYIDEKFACAIQLAEYDENGNPKASKLGELEDGIPLGISLQDHLENIKDENLGRSYVQLNDIPLSKNVWKPIGGSDGDASFWGRYDGAGYEISGLNLSMPIKYSKPVANKDSKWGLFGANEGYIINTHVSGMIDGGQSNDESYFGGLVGRNLPSGIVVLSSANVEIKFVNANTNEQIKTGGFVGYNEGRIEQSYASGNITNGGMLGGFVGAQNTQDGENRAKIVNCYSTGTIKKEKSNFQPGQFAGNVGKKTKQDSSLYQNCFAYNEAIKKVSNQSAADTNEYSFVGNGRNPGANNMVNCYMLGISKPAQVGTPLSASAMAQQDSFPTFDFLENGIWIMGEHFPQLVGNSQRYEYTSYTSEEPTTIEAEEIEEQNKSNFDENESLVVDPESDEKPDETESENLSPPVTEEESKTKDQTETDKEDQEETKPQTDKERQQETGAGAGENEQQNTEETQAVVGAERNGQNTLQTGGGQNEEN